MTEWHEAGELCRECQGDLEAAREFKRRDAAAAAVTGVAFAPSRAHNWGGRFFYSGHVLPNRVEMRRLREMVGVCFRRIAFAFPLSTEHGDVKVESLSTDRGSRTYGTSGEYVKMDPTVARAFRMLQKIMDRAAGLIFEDGQHEGQDLLGQLSRGEASVGQVCDRREGYEKRNEMKGAVRLWEEFDAFLAEPEPERWVG